MNSTVPREQLRMRTVVVLYRRMRNELQSGRERTNVRNSGNDSEHKNQLREWEREGGVGKAKRSKVSKGSTLRSKQASSAAVFQSRGHAAALSCCCRVQITQKSENEERCCCAIEDEQIRQRRAKSRHVSDCRRRSKARQSKASMRPTESEKGLAERQKGKGKEQQHDYGGAGERTTQHKGKVGQNNARQGTEWRH